MNFRNIFNREKVETVSLPQTPKRKKRFFNAARLGRLNNFLPAYTPINQSITVENFFIVQRARALAQNSDHVTAFLKLMRRNIVGASGFSLQCRAIGPDGAADSEANAKVEALWREYQSPLGGYVTRCGQFGGREFDELIVNTLLIDGEAFIRVIPDTSSRFGVRYELLDTLNIDYDYNEPDLPNGEFIRCSIRFDRDWRPLGYYVRYNPLNLSYHTGERVYIPAREIIHLFRREFPQQVRGVTPLAPAVIALNQLDSYKEAELVAARMQACNMAMYVKSVSGGGDVLDDEEVDENGDYLSEMSPGQIAFAPDGYDVKQLQNNHPSGNFGGFVKSVCRGIFASLGVSYNKGASDYEAVNFSSLREAALEDRAEWREFQAYLIENWKDRQYEHFLRGAVLSGALDAVRFPAYRNHHFYGRSWDWVDPVKDISAIDSAIRLGLTDHITEIEKRGGDVDEVLDREALYLKKRKERNLPPPEDSNYSETIEINEETNNPETEEN